MSVEEKLTQVNERLTMLGKEKEHLSYEELNDVLPEGIVSSIDIDNIFIISDSSDTNVIESEKKQKFVNETLETDNKCESSGTPETEISSEDLSHTDDLARIYLREMGTVPLLTREEEINIAKRIESGRIKMLKALTQIPIASRELICLKEMVIMDRPVSSEQEDNIEKEIGLSILQLRRIYREIEIGRKETDLAKKKLVEANLRLVVSIAKKYLNRGLPFLDLIQEGNLGLMKAVDKFEHQRGYKFSTYATWWIRQSITRAIADKARTIRIPVHMIETINKLTRTTHILVQELGREPTPQEISKRTNMNVNKVKMVLKATQGILSLETPIGEEGDTHLSDFMEDKKAESPLDSFININLAEKMDNILQTLNYREEKVIRKRFGISELSTHTLEEVGQDFNVTRERIRQIEANALKKLRHPNRSKHVKDFYDS